jgi:hypothetical protein
MMKDSNLRPADFSDALPTELITRWDSFTAKTAYAQFNNLGAPVGYTEPKLRLCITDLLQNVA